MFLTHGGKRVWPDSISGWSSSSHHHLTVWLMRKGRQITMRREVHVWFDRWVLAGAGEWKIQIWKRNISKDRWVDSKVRRLILNLHALLTRLPFLDRLMAPCEPLPTLLQPAASSLSACKTKTTAQTDTITASYPGQWCGEAWWNILYPLIFPQGGAGDEEHWLNASNRGHSSLLECCMF